LIEGKGELVLNTILRHEVNALIVSAAHENVERSARCDTRATADEKRGGSERTVSFNRASRLFA
jgi:hypothetical protein